MSENMTDQSGFMPSAQSAPINFAELAQQNNARMNVATVPINASEPMQVTSMQDIVSFARGSVVRLPDFAEGQPFVARMRRPSLLALAKFGKIPNSLLTTAGSLFSGDGMATDSDNEDMLAKVYEVCEIIADASLIEPRLADLQEAGIELTDEQMMAIMNYSQGGVKALESFR